MSELCKWTGKSTSKCKCGECVTHIVSTDEWIQPIRKGYRMECCDCGLVHTLDFRIYRGQVQFLARRDNRRTAIRRRQRNIRIKFEAAHE